MPEVLFGPVPHKQAASFIKTKPVVARSVFSAMVPELQAYAFTVSGVESVKVLQKLRDRIADLPAGGDWAEIRKDLANEISPFLVEGDDAEAKEKAEGAAFRKAELLLRTHGYTAYQATQTAVMQRQMDVFPYWKYQTAQDDRVRDSHEALDGKILPANSPFWNRQRDWGCRCDKVPMSADDVAEVEAEDEKKVPEARRVISGDRLHALETSNQLTTVDKNGMPLFINVGTKGTGSWNQTDLKPSIAELQKKYDPEVWASFRTWAKGTKIGGGSKTVWSWLGGSGEWPDLAELKSVKRLGGSTGAELVKDTEGRKFVMKAGAGGAHITSEVAADQAYAVLGADTPKAKLYPSATPTKLAEFVDGRTLKDFLTSATAEEKEAAFAQLRQHFVADALFANYDVIGLELDNVMVDKSGRVWRIDNGGSFAFRAQGKRKDNFGAEVTELRTMRDRSINAAAASVFDGVTDADIKTQIEKILPKRDELLAVMPADVRDVMAKRLDFLAEMVKPQGGDAFAEQVEKARIVGRAAKWDKRDIEDTQVLFWPETDKNGAPVLRAKMKLTEAGSAKLMEQLKASLPAAPAGTPQDNYWSTIEKAAKTVNKHAADGAYNSATLAELAKVKKQLEAAELKGANAGMKAYYLGIIDELELAKATKVGTGKFSAWTYRPEKGEASAAPFRIERAQVSYTAKETRRGNAKDKGDRIYTHDAFVVDLGDTEVKFVPFKNADGASDFNAPYALRGYVEVLQKAPPSSTAVKRVAEQLAQIGLNTEPATDAYAELVYLRKGMQIRSDVFTPAKRKAADAVLEDTKLTEREKIAKLKGQIKKELGLALPDEPRPGYDWRAKGNSFGHGWERTERWDLPRTEVEKELKGWTLRHHSSTKPEVLIDAILEGGGDFTSTTERLRKGIPISSGMSPQADLGTGGANYLFTRITPPTQGDREVGFNFKIGNLARQDAFSFGTDRYGNVSTAAAYKERGKTIADFKEMARNSSNETILKYGVPLLDELDSVVVSSEAERKRVIEAFKKHGWDQLPDGRAVIDIVRTKK